MQKLKAILIQGFAGNLHRIKISSGDIPSATSAAGDAMLANATTFADSDLDQLFQFLFPNDQPALAAGQIVKGVLNVPGKGKILLIATPNAPKCVRMYLPPEGPTLFEQDWVKVNSKTVPPGSHANPIAGSPKPPPAPAAQAQHAVSSGFVPSGLAAPPPVANLASPIPLQRASETSDAPPGGGFAPDLGSLPPDLYDAPPDHFGGGNAENFATPSHLHPPIAQIAPDTSAPHPMPSAAPPVIGMGGFAPQVPPPVSAPAFISEHGAGPKAPMPQIEWGAERPGESIVSEGQFPIDAIFKQMIEQGASDLHMTMGQPICFRIDGSVKRIGQNLLDENSMAQFLMPTMPVDNQREFAEIGDTDYAYEIRGIGRFRVNIFRDRNGVGAVMRHIPSKILTAKQLGLPPAILQFCSLTKGLVVVTGPTGSGKSTTLAAMIDEINRTRDDHILTIEDPIEFVHTQQRCLVNQREVGRHTGSFSRALKAALREDPDIVLIGEMRDLETIEIAIETAETGHLVFGTLHTTTAIGTVDRIIDQFPADQQGQIRMMLSSSLKGVIAQTLLKKNGGGRVAAHEILVSDSSVSALIRESKNHMIENQMQSQKRSGNLLMNESLLSLVKANIINVKEAYMKCVDKKGFLASAKRAGINFDPAVDMAESA